MVERDKTPHTTNSGVKVAGEPGSSALALKRLDYCSVKNELHPVTSAADLSYVVARPAVLPQLATSAAALINL